MRAEATHSLLGPDYRQLLQKDKSKILAGAGLDGSEEKGFHQGPRIQPNPQTINYSQLSHAAVSLFQPHWLKRLSWKLSVLHVNTGRAWDWVISGSNHTYTMAVGSSGTALSEEQVTKPIKWMSYYSACGRFPPRCKHGQSYPWPSSQPGELLQYYKSQENWSPRQGSLVVEMWHLCHSGSWVVVKLLTQGRAVLDQFCIITPAGPEPEHSQGKRPRKHPFRLAKLNSLVLNTENLNL